MLISKSINVYLTARSSINFCFVFSFCLNESKDCLEGQTKMAIKSHAMDRDLNFKPISGSLLHELENIQTNQSIMTALQALEIAYNEMKEHLDEPSHGEKTVRTLPVSDAVKEVTETIEEIQEIFRHQGRTKRRRRKPSTRVIEETDISEDESLQTIKDKRKSIKDKALKVQKKPQSMIGNEQPSSSKESIGSPSPVKIKSKPQIDPKHFKKISEVQKIFEMNTLFE